MVRSATHVSSRTSHRQPCSHGTGRLTRLQNSPQRSSESMPHTAHRHCATTTAPTPLPTTTASCQATTTTCGTLKTRRTEARAIWPHGRPRSTTWPQLRPTAKSTGTDFTLPTAPLRHRAWTPCTTCRPTTTTSWLSIWPLHCASKSATTRCSPQDSSSQPTRVCTTRRLKTSSEPRRSATWTPTSWVPISRATHARNTM